MSPPSQPKGVLNSNYSENRNKKKELYFRYRVRAMAVIRAWQDYAINHESLRLLDLGAADGKTLAFMASELPITEAIGVEFNQQLIDCADDSLVSGSNTKLVRGDVTNLKDFQENSFDLVTALALLEHISDPSKVVAEASRLLKPGGLFVSTSPVPFWDHIAVKTGLLKEDHHECDMHADKFKSFIKSNPLLELVDFKQFMFAPIGVLPYLGFQPTPVGSLKIDRAIHRLRLFNWLFVNQLAVARKKY